MTNRRRIVATITVLLIVGCTGPAVIRTAPTPSSGAPSVAPSTRSPQPTQLSGLGVSRATMVAAVDAAFGPHRIVWMPERLAKDGTPIVEGSTESGGLDALYVVLAGPADDLLLIQASARPATSIDEAELAVAVLRASVPAAEVWLRADFAQPLDIRTSVFGGITVEWLRDVDVFDARLSMLTVSYVPLGPVPTPTPPLPTPTATIDLVQLLPASIAGMTMDRTHPDISQVPDGRPDCLPLCRHEIEAFAVGLGVDVASLDVAIALPDGDATLPIAVAIIRVPGSVRSFLFPEWMDALDTPYPDLVLGRCYCDEIPAGNRVEVVRRAYPPDDAPFPAWYLRGTREHLVIVSNALAGHLFAPPSRAVLDALRQLP